MIWKKRVKKIKNTPKLGDFKRKLRFAFFPLKIDNKVLWLESYIKVWEFKAQVRTEEIAVSSGGFEDALSFTGLINERTVSRTYSFDGWAFYGREFLPVNVA